MSLKLNYNTASLRVCVDRAAEGHIQGQVVSQRLRAPFSFTDVSDLVLQIDTLMDVQRFPQAFQQPRSFVQSAAPGVPAALSPEEMMDIAAVNAFHGALDTFQLYISARHNSTWQGFLDWLDGSDHQMFDSTLEFLKSLDHRFLS